MSREVTLAKVSWPECQDYESMTVDLTQLRRQIKFLAGLECTNAKDRNLCLGISELLKAIDGLGRY